VFFDSQYIRKLYVNVTGRLQVLYTDYNFALIHSCAVEPLSNSKCPSDQSRVVVYGRRKSIDGQLPDDVRQFMEPVANDACLYLEDFVSTTLPPGRYHILLIVINTVYHGGIIFLLLVYVKQPAGVE